MKRTLDKQFGLYKPAAGFMLLEAMVAVAIFALGVIALGHCVTNCLAAERLRAEDRLARQALENRFEEIRSGAIEVTKETTENLAGSFSGLKLKQSFAPLLRKNELDQELDGLRTVTLEVSWLEGGESHQRTLTFYVTPRVR